MSNLFARTTVQITDDERKQMYVKIESHLKALASATTADQTVVTTLQEALSELDIIGIPKTVETPVVYTVDLALLRYVGKTIA